ncbi:hypothetical protein KJ785_01500 [Patescibacteria group bacterium]|nr:hypothetical protein [Patescibacteria group bacterium]
MCINKLGQIVWEQWQWLAERYPYIVLHDFVVMPNHVHAILQIDSSRCRRGGSGPAHIARQTDGLCKNGAYADGLNKNDSLIVQCEGGSSEGGSRPAPTGVDEIKILPLYNIIGALKTTSSKHIHRHGFANFKWQRSFYDHIIRNEKSYFAIQNYINQNPAIWWRDRNNI